MAETLTDVDQFDASIQWPTAGELASASDVRDKAIQRLANRTRNNKNRIDGHDTDIANLESELAASHASAMYGFSGSTVASGSVFTLSLIRRSSTDFALSSNEVTV